MTRPLKPTRLFNLFHIIKGICLLCFLFLLSSLGGELRIGCLHPKDMVGRGSYPGALQCLLAHVRQEALAALVPEPVELADFASPKLMDLPFVYANFADRENWEFSDAEAACLKAYLERGGFLFIDAGITASFLRQTSLAGQHHSYAEWDACPELKDAFKKLFPQTEFQSLKRSDPMFKAFYQGLPDTSLLPDSVREYTQKEKWPDGTYSTVVLKLHGRVAVMATPIIAMGWGRNSLGQWLTHIQFRVLEDTAGLTDYVKNASYSGERFEVAREDGAKDVVFCQSDATPSWNHEPSGHARIFKYYGSPEINDFAHVFYTRLGTNILLYALTR